MQLRREGLLSILRSLQANPFQTHHPLLPQCRTIVKVRLKWVKNRGLDHIIDVQTDLKAACLIKDAIVRSSTGYLTSRNLADSQKLLGLTVPTLRFVRRYPTLFEEFPHPKYPSLPCFKLTQIAQLLHDQELKVYDECQTDLIHRLCRVLMMTSSRMAPLLSLYPLKWDLGLPDDFDKNLVRRYPDYFLVVKGKHGSPCLQLASWPAELAVSELQKAYEKGESEASPDTPAGMMQGYRQFKRGKQGLEFPMSFPRGYGARKKVKAWMEEFHKLPYISPYEDSRGIDPNSELMEKRIVGLLHEFLSLTIYKKTQRNYLRSLREELNLPEKFTRIFTRYPGIFYLSLKCKTTTVALREGYRRGKLVDPHPISRHRDKFQHVMRTGLLYRSKGIGQLDSLLDDVEQDRREQENDEEDNEMSDEYYEEGSDQEVSSDDG